MPRPRSQPTLNIIGPGRLGMALALALSDRGYRVRSIVGRRLSSIRRAANLLDAPAELLVIKDIQKMPQADLLIIATPDDQIASVVKTLASLNIDTRKRPIALHTSGALSSVVLTPLAGVGWVIGSMHPLVSVSDPAQGASSFSGAFWCVEGDAKALSAAKTIVKNLKGQTFTVPAAAKPLYHAAAVMTSGNVVALFDVAIDMLHECGLSRREAKRVLLPLLQSATHNLIDRDPSRSLTGTFSRGDIATVEQHLAALSGKKLVEAAALYRLLGKKSLHLAEENGLETSVAKRIRKLMSDKL